MRDKKIDSKLISILAKKSWLFLKPQFYYFEKFNMVTKYCLESLHPEYKRIMESILFNHNYKYWWLDHYSQSSFYRKRNKALTSFVLLFETIYENFNDSSINNDNASF